MGRISRLDVLKDSLLASNPTHNNNNRYKRAVLKLSGEALKGERAHGIDPDSVAYAAGKIREIVELGVEVAVVVGGGNIWRGAEVAAQGMDRATADYAGMLATVINALTLQDSLERLGVVTRTQSAIAVQAVAEPYIRRRALRHLEKGRVVIFAAGTGSPHMTTDTAAALRAVELSADILLISKHEVDGVYDSDPKINKEAVKFDRITYMDALNLRLSVMDSTALSLCMDNHLPIVVFDLFTQENMRYIIDGYEIGTYISDDAG